MYQHFIYRIRTVLDPLGNRAFLLVAALLLGLLLVSALLIWGSRAWRRRIAELEARPGRWPLVGLFLANFLRLALGLAGLGFLALLLLVQAGLFAEQHGQVTERNYQAVRSKWGISHEQRELAVTHQVWETETVEELAGGGQRRRVAPAVEPAPGEREEEVLSDESFSVARDEQGRPLDPQALVRRTVRRMRRTIPEPGTIVSAAIELELASSPRELGGAAYAGFEDTCLFEYTVANQADHPTQAFFRFPLPGQGYGLYDRITVQVRKNGQAAPPALTYRDGELAWELPLAAGERVEAAIGYHSRGLEFFRYWPGNLRERYLVALHLKGVPRERLNFPIGSMSPQDDLKQLAGADYTLHWDLSRAVTNYSIGVLLPAPEQPGYRVARILKAAPRGLALLALLLVLTRLLLGARPELLPLGLTIVAGYLGSTLFANLSDHLSSFGWAFLIGMGLPALAAALFWRRRDGKNFLGRQTAALVLLFGLGFPLAAGSDDYSGLLLNLGYVGLTVYVMLLAAGAYRRRCAAGGAGGAPEPGEPEPAEETTTLPPAPGP